MYKVYEYGQSHWTSINEAMALEQISRRHRLWNNLVEIDRSYRARVRDLLRDPVQDAIDAVKARIEELRGEIRRRRKAARKRTVELETLPAELAGARAELAALVKQAKERRPAVIAERKDALGKLRETHYANVKQATHESDLYWCNYDDVLTCYEVASKRAAKAGVDLRFQRWDGCGKVAVRYQQGLSVAEALAGTDTRFQLDPVPEAAHTSRVRSVRRELARTNCRIRVGSNPDRSPVWLEIPIILHRPLPAVGKIRTVFAVRSIIDGRRRWKVCICVDDGISQEEAPLRTGPAAAVDLGWRQVPEGLRVAYWADEAGNHGQWVLGAEVLHEHAKLTDLRRIQDNHLEVAKTALLAWLATQPAAPEWMGDVSHLKEWRSRGRMARLAAAAPAGVPDTVKQILSTFAERHWHLMPWEENLRDQVMRRRREIYRGWARELGKSHGTIVLEKFDLRGVAERGREEAARTKPVASDRRVIAAVSVLRHALKGVGQTAEVDAAYSTQRCSWCGNQEKWDAAPSLVHRCGKCSQVFDQDYNAARNLLRSHIEGRGAQKPDLPETGPAVDEEVLMQSGG
jgi:Putative transposase DNA-binding domain